MLCSSLLKLWILFSTRIQFLFLACLSVTLRNQKLGAKTKKSGRDRASGGGSCSPRKGRQVHTCYTSSSMGLKILGSGSYLQISSQLVDIDFFANSILPTAERLGVAQAPGQSPKRGYSSLTAVAYGSGPFQTVPYSDAVSSYMPASWHSWSGKSHAPGVRCFHTSH